MKGFLLLFSAPSWSNSRNLSCVCHVTPFSPSSQELLQSQSVQNALQVTEHFISHNNADKTQLGLMAYLTPAG